jgi:integrase
VAELLDDLRVDHEVRGLASVRTVTAHIAALNAAFARHERAVDVTTARLNLVVQGWQREGAAPATVNKRMASLRRAFSLARESEPPKVVTVPRFPRLEEHNARQGFFEKGDFFAVLGHLPDDGLRDFAEWCYWTGMRKGEAAALTWAAFDRETWTLTLAAKDAKSRKARRIPLVGPLRAIIERRLVARRLDAMTIFHREGAPVYEFRKSWRSACRAAGVEGRLFHDLRRTGVRNLRRAGVDRRVAMTISGHLTESIFERYNIGADEDLRDAVAKVAVYVDGLPTTRRVTPLPKAASA